MDRRSAAIFTLILAIASAGSLPAADTTSFGVGLGALYNGLGGNLALIKADDMRYLSVGCTEARSSSASGTDLTCGVGVGWLRSDILTRKNSKHGIGLNLALDYDQFHSEIEPSIRLPYVFFFRGIERRGFNLGLAPLVRWDADGTEIGVMFEVGYQF
jgi:hypothetical protein